MPHFIGKLPVFGLCVRAACVTVVTEVENKLPSPRAPKHPESTKPVESARRLCPSPSLAGSDQKPHFLMRCDVSSVMPLRALHW